MSLNACFINLKDKFLICSLALFFSLHLTFLESRTSRQQVILVDLSRVVEATPGLAKFSQKILKNYDQQFQKFSVSLYESKEKTLDYHKAYARFKAKPHPSEQQIEQRVLKAVQLVLAKLKQLAAKKRNQKPEFIVFNSGSRFRLSDKLKSIQWGTNMVLKESAQIKEWKKKYPDITEQVIEEYRKLF